MFLEATVSGFMEGDLVGGEKGMEAKYQSGVSQSVMTIMHVTVFVVSYFQLRISLHM